MAAVDSWPLSVHTRLCLDIEQQGEREKDRDRKEKKRNIRVGKKKREREVDCTSLCSGLKKGIDGMNDAATGNKISIPSPHMTGI